jgi:hypothetical protein
MQGVKRPSTSEDGMMGRFSKRRRCQADGSLSVRRTRLAEAQGRDAAHCCQTAHELVKPNYWRKTSFLGWYFVVLHRNE